MTETHITTRDGQKAVYSSTQIDSALASGRIPSDSIYWQAGMADWRPVSELMRHFPPPPISPPLPSYRFFKDPTFLTNLLSFMVYTQAGVALISLFSDLAQLALLGSSNVTEVSAAANDARQQIVGIIYLLVYVATAIVFLTWINRANKNCHGFTSGMEFTSGWAIGWYFVPFANLIKPFQAMSEIWRVSHDPVNWKSANPPALLRWWWGLWLISGFVGQASFRMSMGAESLSELEAATTVSMISALMDFPLCVVAAVMVGKIFKAQKSLVSGA